MSATTRIRSIDRDDPARGPLEAAASILRAGGLVAFATETVYGLGAEVTNPAAVARIFAAKGRPATNPLIVHVDSLAMARSCVAIWPDHAETLAATFWPGPLSLVLPRSTRISDEITAGRDTVAVRMPEPAVARGLITATTNPIAAPSANRSTGLSPTTALHVLADLGDRVDLILDSGPTTVGLESTVLDLTTREPRILRPGPITAAELEYALSGLRVREAAGDSAAADDQPQLSPGRMAVHYAPRTESIRVEAPDDLVDYPWPDSVALVVSGRHEAPSHPPGVHRIDLVEPAAAALDLYAVLHECDDLGFEHILILLPPDRPEWGAIRDRLRRATRPLDGHA